MYVIRTAGLVQCLILCLPSLKKSIVDPRELAITATPSQPQSEANAINSFVLTEGMQSDSFVIGYLWIKCE